MANEVDYSPIKYVGNGSTVDFSFDWKVIDTDELIVELEEISSGETTTQTRGSDYTVTINSVGGAVTFLTAPSSEYYVVLSRDTSQYQSKSYSTSTGFQGSEVEKSFDKVSCNLQEMDYNIETFKEDVQNEVSDFESTLSDFEDALTVSFETFKAELTEEVNTTVSENKADTDSQISEFEEEINATISTVIEAADKINALEEAVETATEQASSAASSAASASETLEEITTLAQELEGNIENLADTSLSNLVQKGEDKLNYNVFCVNTGDTTDEGEPAFLSVVSSTDDDEVTTSTLTTSGEFAATTAAGVSYTVSDTLTLDITDYEEGTYNVYINPVTLELSAIDNTLTYGITFPDDAADGDYLLNTAKVPYDLQKINITTDEDTEETTTTVTTGLNEVYAGTLVIES